MKFQVKKRKYSKQDYKRARQLAKKLQLSRPLTRRVPREAFIKIKQTYLVDITNLEAEGRQGYIADFVFRGNSLHQTVPGTGEQYLGAPIFQMAQFYRKYYIWKSKVNVDFTDIGRINAVSENNLGQRGIYLYPNGLGFTQNSTGISWSQNGQAPECLPNVRYKKYCLQQFQYKGPLKLRNSMHTKKMFAFKTDEELDFTGTIRAGGTSDTPQYEATHPVNQWFWHLLMANMDEDSEQEDTLHGRCVITIEYYVRFFQPDDFLWKATEI